MAVISFQTTFDFVNRKVRLLDTSNYAGQSILLTDIVGVIQVNSPRGIVYNNTDYNTPDINQDISLYSGWIDLPVNAAGYILAGSYTITLTIRQTNGTISMDSNTYTYSFVIPAITIT